MFCIFCQLTCNLKSLIYQEFWTFPVGIFNAKGYKVKILQESCLFPSFLSISIYIVISNLRKSPAQLALKDCLSRVSLIFPQVWLRVTTFKKNNQKLTHKPFYTQVFFNMKASIISAWLLMLATTACISRVNGATGKEGCNRGLGLQ